MRQWKKATAVLLLVCLILTLFAGCGGKKKKDPNSITAYVGQTIFQETLDPVKGGMSYGYPFINNALLKVDTKSNYVGDLATDWSVSPDSLRYTFKLRKGVKFTDGTPFTADDVVFTYQQVQKHQAENQNVDLTRLKSAKKVDDYAVEFPLKEPYSPFLDTAAVLGIVPSDSYKSGEFDQKPVGTGPWKVVEYDPNQQIIVEKNPDYYGGVAHINQVTIVNMDQDTALSAAKSGQLDVVMVGSNVANEKIDGMKLIPLTTMDVRNISLPVVPLQTRKDAEGKAVKVGNNVTCDKAVRKALAIGIDRKTIIKNALNGIGKPATGFTDNLLWASDKTWTDNRVGEAKQILDAAGWKVGKDGYRQKGSQKCEFTVAAASNDNDRYQLAVAVAENAKKLGIKINVVSKTWDELYDLKNTVGVVWGFGQYSPMVLEQLFYSKEILNSQYGNSVCYSNPKVDSLIDKALDANNQQTAISYWKQAQDAANDDYPYLYIVNIQHCYFVSDRLNISEDTQIAHPHGHGAPIINNMNDWTLKS